MLCFLILSLLAQSAVAKENAHKSQPVSGGREKRLETIHTNKVERFRALPSVIGENSKEKQHRLLSWIKIRLNLPCLSAN